MKIKLRKMDEAEFDRYLAYLIPDYANDLSANFMISIEKANAESEKLMGELLPDKQETSGQHLYQIYSIEEDKDVGVIWYNIRTESNKAYSYHILIKEEFRHQGFATEVMKVLEESMRKSGITSLGLNVFSTSPNARKFGRIDSRSPGKPRASIFFTQQFAAFKFPSREIYFRLGQWNTVACC